MRLNTEYNFIFSNNINNINYKEMNYLYIPIIGSNAFTVFNFLHFQFKNNGDNFNFNISDLSKILNLNLELIDSAIKILENNNLLQIFYSKNDNKILLKLINPKNFKDFFNDILYSKALITNTNLNYVNNVKAIFNNKKIIDNNVLNQKDEINNVDINDYNINNVSKNNNNNKSNFKEIYNKKIEQLQKYEPNKYYELIKEGKLSIYELSVINEIKSILKKEEVVNCLLDFSYLKNGKFLIKDYLIKIAKTMKSLIIENVDDAMEYLKNAYNISKSKKYSNNLNLNKVKENIENKEIKTEFNENKNENNENKTDNNESKESLVSEEEIDKLVASLYSSI